jgi:hypothetical protein
VKPIRPLTHKERKFADLVLQGMAGSAAYRTAYESKVNAKSASVLAHRVRHRPAVEAYIAEQQAKAADMMGATRAEKRRELRLIILNRKLDPDKRVRAIMADNIMTGDNKPVRFEGEITLNGIFRALKSTTALPGPDEIIDIDPNGPMAQP